MADPDIELRGWGGGGAVFCFTLLALPAFLPSFFFTQNKGWRGRSLLRPPWGQRKVTVVDRGTTVKKDQQSASRITFGDLLQYKWAYCASFPSH